MWLTYARAYVIIITIHNALVEISYIMYMINDNVEIMSCFINIYRQQCDII